MLYFIFHFAGYLNSIFGHRHDRAPIDAMKRSLDRQLARFREAVRIIYGRTYIYIYSLCDSR